jgi:hypothetical protein
MHHSVASVEACHVAHAAIPSEQKNPARKCDLDRGDHVETVDLQRPTHHCTGFAALRCAKVFRAIRASTAPNGNALPHSKLMSVAYELESRSLCVTSTAKPAQILDGASQARKRTFAEQLLIRGVRPAVTSGIAHAES